MSLAALDECDHPEQIDLVVVDDDSLTLELVSWNLRNTSVSHELFHDQEQAIQLLSVITPRALIVDFYMPIANGVEFLDRLTRRNRLEGCEIFLCSAITPQHQYLERLKDIGASVLTKDQLVDPSGLLRIIDQLPDVTVKNHDSLRQTGPAVARLDRRYKVLSREHTLLYKK